MTFEKYKGIGRRGRRLLVKLWKGSGTSLSLRQWAAQSEVGDLAQVWLQAKRSR